VRAADGSPVPVRQRLWRVALGTLLACSPGPCPQEVLAAALWPAGFPASLDGALRAALHGVREVLRPKLRRAAK
jgi:DNA-binding SARP family transcriptional activator